MNGCLPLTSTELSCCVADGRMSALARLKARRPSGSGLQPPRGSAAISSAATAHHQHDAYLGAFDGPGGLLDRPDVQPRCSGDLLNCSVPAYGITIAPQPTATACQLRAAPPLEAIRLQLSQNRNLLCASVSWERWEAVFGSADHAGYTVDLRRHTKARTLYTNTAGHCEWVAAVAHLPDGRIVTGGLDAKVCVWPARGAASCQELAGHAGPISQVEPVPAAVGGAATFVTASYDKRLVVWRASGGNSCTVQQQQVLDGHRAPVLQLQVAGSWAASGDRDGALLQWDLAVGAPVGRPLSAHLGHCTALEWWSPAGSSSWQVSESDGATSSRAQPLLLLSGGQDGCVRLWDLRTRQQVAQHAAHAGVAGRGAVGSIVAGPGDLVASAGADRAVTALDARRNLEPVWSTGLPDFPYSMAAATGSSTMFVGCGDGSVAAFDGNSGSLCYTLAASGSAVRTLHASAELLVAGCDDGNAVIYSI